MKKTAKKIIIIIVLFVLIVACSIYLFKNKQNNEKDIPDNENINENIVEEDNAMIVDEIETFSIETKYVTLEFPSKWKDKVDITINDEEPYTVSFSYNDSPLFDLVFNGTSGFRLGSMINNGQVININVNFYDVDSDSMSNEEYLNYCAMQEDINVIIDKLVENYGFIIGESGIEAEENTNIYKITTKYCNLSYPEKWKDLVNVEIDDSDIYTVKFSYKDIPLFNLTFNEGNGYKLGNMNIDGNDITIYIDDFNFNKDELSEQDYVNCCAMSSDVNVILEHLIEDYGFVYILNS